MDKHMTQAYQRHGALLAVSVGDARTLITRGLAVSAPSDPSSSLMLVSVLGRNVDRFVPGEPPRLFLVGGVEIVRDDEKGDAIASIKTINIDGLFDEENE